MSNYNEIEERLFVLLDTVEKQTAENAEVKNDVLSVLESIKQHQATLAEQNQSIISTANQQLSNIKMTQQDFNKLVFHSISVSMQDQIDNAVQVATINAITSGARASIQNIDSELDKFVGNIEKWNDKADNWLAKLYKTNIEKSHEVMDSLEHQKEKLGSAYLKMIALFVGCLFILMCVFFFIIYLVSVPSETELQRLRAEKAQIQRHIIQLKDNRNQWLRDAEKRGY